MLEREVDRLRHRLDASTTSGQGAAPAPNWIEEITGSMAGNPEFEEVVRLGRAARQADHPADDDNAAPGDPPA